MHECNWLVPRARGYPVSHGSAPDLDAWFAGPLGRMLMEQERAVVAASLECAFGLHCVQVGAWGDPGDVLARARTRRASLVRDGRPTESRSSPTPRRSRCKADSVDVLLLPHTLEFAREPHEVLREVTRVLTGEGELVVLGFEPLGTWSLRSAFHARRLAARHQPHDFRDAARRLAEARRLRSRTR
jgi:hypothetical protein